MDSVVVRSNPALLRTRFYKTFLDSVMASRMAENKISKKAARVILKEIEDRLGAAFEKVIVGYEDINRFEIVIKEVVGGGGSGFFERVFNVELIRRGVRVVPIKETESRESVTSDLGTETVAEQVSELILKRAVLELKLPSNPSLVQVLDIIANRALLKTVSKRFQTEVNKMEMYDRSVVDEFKEYIGYRELVGRLPELEQKVNAMHSYLMENRELLAMSEGEIERLRLSRLDTLEGIRRGGNNIKDMEDALHVIDVRLHFSNIERRHDSSLEELNLYSQRLYNKMHHADNPLLRAQILKRLTKLITFMQDVHDYEKKRILYYATIVKPEFQAGFLNTYLKPIGVYISITGFARGQGRWLKTILTVNPESIKTRSMKRRIFDYSITEELLRDACITHFSNRATAKKGTIQEILKDMFAPREGFELTPKYITVDKVNAMAVGAGIYDTREIQSYKNELVNFILEKYKDRPDSCLPVSVGARVLKAVRPGYVKKVLGEVDVIVEEIRNDFETMYRRNVMSLSL